MIPTMSFFCAFSGTFKCRAVFISLNRFMTKHSCLGWLLVLLQKLTELKFRIFTRRHDKRRRSDEHHNLNHGWARRGILCQCPLRQERSDAPDLARAQRWLGLVGEFCSLVWSEALQPRGSRRSAVDFACPQGKSRMDQGKSRKSLIEEYQVYMPLSMSVALTPA